MLTNRSNRNDIFKQIKMVKQFFYFAAILLLHSTSASIAPNASFYPTRLKTPKDCEKFARQTRFGVARCDGYYNAKRKTFFIDEGFNFSVVECGQFNKDGRMPTIIYEVKGVKDFAQCDMIVDMIHLEMDLDRYVEIVPQIIYFVGPGGDKSETFVNLNKLLTSWAVIKPAEKENHLAYYPQEFFDNLLEVQYLPVGTKYIMLNGWHLRNIPYQPVLNEKFPLIIAGIIIYVERATAHMINKKDVVSFLNKNYSIPIWFDMPGSPDFAGATILGHSLTLFIAITILAYFS